MAPNVTHYMVGALCAILFVMTMLPSTDVTKTTSRILALQDSIGIHPNPETLHCRERTLRILMGGTLGDQSGGDQQQRDSDLQYVARCWQEAMAYYLTFPLNFQFGSHVLPLLASAWTTDGAVCELGSGWYSTPMLHRIAQLQGRFLLTADSNPRWLKYFTMFSADFHHLYYVNVDGKQLVVPNSVDSKAAFHEVNAWSAVGSQVKNWSVIFVDHAPGEQRYVDLARLRGDSDLFIVHDTDPISLSVYGNDGKILESFKYKYVIRDSWSERHIHVLSDRRGDLVTAVGHLCDIGMKMLKSTVDSP